MTTDVSIPAAERRPAWIPSVLRESPPHFVGRDQEIRALMDAAAACFRGHSAMVFLRGDAGAGKSALLSEFGRRASLIYPEVLLGVARVSSTHALSYAPFKAVMEQLLLADPHLVNESASPVAPLDVVSSLLQRLGVQHLGTLGSFVGVAFKDLRDRMRALSMDEAPHLSAAPLFDGDSIVDFYAKVICDLGARWPILLLLDDIHWADASSLRLLLHLGTFIERLPVMIVCTRRSDTPIEDKTIAELLRRLGRLGCLTIDLQSQARPRDPSAAVFCQAYVASKYGQSFSDDFINALSAITNGNALFVSEITANMEERGLLANVNGAWELRPWSAMLESALPVRIEHVIGERFDRLDPESRRILKCASVEGETFTVQVVSGVLGVSETALRDVLAETLMRSNGLVREADIKRLQDGRKLHRFEFSHILIQRYIYQHVLSQFERVELHEAVASELSKVWSGLRSEIAPELALHSALAGLSREAIEYALLAAQSLSQQRGWSEVTRYARLGIEIAERDPNNRGALDPSVLLELRLHYAKGEFEGGLHAEDIDHTQAGIAALLSAMHQVDRVKPSLAAEVHLTLGRLHAARRLTHDDAGNEHLTRALQIYEQLGDKTGIIEVLSQEVLDSNPPDQMAGAEQLQRRRRCLELAEELGDPLTIARSLLFLARHYINYDTDDTGAPLALAEQHSRRAKQIAAGAGDRILECHADLALSWAYHHMGRYGAALEQLRKDLLLRARELGQTVLEAESLTDLAHYDSLLVDSRASATESMKRAFTFRIRMGRHAIHDREQYAAFLFRAGQFDQALSLLQTALDRSDVSRGVRIQAEIARILQQQGRAEEAGEVLCRIGEEYAKSPRLACEPNPALMLSYAALGRAREARAEAEVIEGRVRCSIQRGVFHTYHDYATELAEVNRLLGDLGAAQRWIEVARRQWEESLTQICDVKRHVMYWEYRLVLGKLLVDAGRLPEAARDLSTTVDALLSYGHFGKDEAQLFLAKAQGPRSNDGTSEDAGR